MINDFSAARREHAWRLRLEGLTLQDIGTRLGVSKTRARDLISTHLDRSAQEIHGSVHPDHVDSLEIGVRANNCLRNANIRWWPELTKWSEHDLLEIPNFGKKSLQELKYALAEKGVRLRGQR